MVRLVLALTAGFTLLAGVGTAGAGHATEDVYIHTGVSSEEEARTYPCAPDADAEGWERSGPVVCLDKVADVWELHYEVADDRGCTYHHASGWSGSCVFDLDMGDHIRVWGTSGIQMTTVTVDWGHPEASTGDDGSDGDGGSSADGGSTGDDGSTWDDTADGDGHSGPGSPSGPAGPAGPSGPDAPDGPDAPTAGGDPHGSGDDPSHPTDPEPDDDPAPKETRDAQPSATGGDAAASDHDPDAPSDGAVAGGAADPSPSAGSVTLAEDAAGSEDGDGGMLLLAVLVLAVSGGLLIRDVRRQP